MGKEVMIMLPKSLTYRNVIRYSALIHGRTRSNLPQQSPEYVITPASSGLQHKKLSLTGLPVPIQAFLESASALGALVFCPPFVGPDVMGEAPDQNLSGPCYDDLVSATGAPASLLCYSCANSHGCHSADRQRNGP